MAASRHQRAVWGDRTRPHLDQKKKKAVQQQIALEGSITYSTFVLFNFCLSLDSVRHYAPRLSHLAARGQTIRFLFAKLQSRSRDLMGEMSHVSDWVNHSRSYSFSLFGQTLFIY